MLPKKSRADSKTLEKVFQKGKFIASPLFTLKFILKNSQTQPRISFVAPKNIAKLATERNKLRRLGYAAIEKHLPLLPKGFAGALIFKKREYDPHILEHDIEKILNKINN